MLFILVVSREPLPLGAVPDFDLKVMRGIPGELVVMEECVFGAHPITIQEIWDQAEQNIRVRKYVSRGWGGKVMDVVV